MKRTFYTAFLLFVVQALSFATPPNSKGLDGYWHSHNNYDNIKIDQNRRALRVKNLFQRGWVRYQKVDNGRFKDYYGNVINVYNRKEIVAKRKVRVRFGPDRYSRPIYFHKNRLNKCKVRNHPRHHDSDYFDYGNYDRYDRNGSNCTADYDPWYNDRRSDRNRNRGDGYYDDNDRNDRRDRNRRFDLSRATGTWLADGGTKVRIQKSERGIKAKIIGKDNWDVYVQDERRSNEFVNNRGSKYIFDGERLRWSNKKGKTKSFKKR